MEKKEIALEETMPTEQEETQSIMPDNTDTVTDDTEQIDDGEKEVQEQSQITIPIKYNKQHLELSVEQAGELAQKGMKFDDMKPVMDKLAYLSATTGQSAEKLIDSLVESNEKELSDRLREMAGDDEVLFSKLLAYEHSKHKTAFERLLESHKAAEAEQVKADNERLAEQFIELNKEFPEIVNIADVPNQVLQNAADNNIRLLDSYLRYRHRENIKINNAQQDSIAAAKSSAGSQKSVGAASEDVEDAFIKGIWSRN